jgi:hypothetical protein
MPLREFVRAGRLLSAVQTERMAFHRQQVRNAIQERDEYVRRHDLDPTIWNPAANWDRSQWFYRDAQRLLDGDDPQDLRVLSRQFSGRPLPTATDDPDIFALVQYRTFKAHLPEYLRLSPPALFYEAGWLSDGIIVNYDTMASWERLAALYQVGLLDRDSPHCLRPGARIVEIGGGYGGLAYFLRRAIGSIDYTIVDLPESLIYSSMYLSASFDSGFQFVPNYRFREISDQRFDLAINTLSMSEMSDSQVRSYCVALTTMAPLFFDQNHDCRYLGLLNAEDVIANYFPYRLPICNRDGFPALIQGFAHIWSSNPIPATMGRVVPGLLLPTSVSELAQVGSSRVFSYFGMICTIPASTEVGPRDDLTRVRGARCFETLEDAQAALEAAGR